MFSNYLKYLIIIFIFIILVPSLFIPNIVSYSNVNLDNQEFMAKLDISSSNLVWPIPGYTKMSSFFGKRISPTNGASSYHQGIDIPAPPGTNLVAPTNCNVNYIGFSGSGGYTIILESYNIDFVYHHVSPNFIIKVRTKYL